MNIAIQTPFEPAIGLLEVKHLEELDAERWDRFIYTLPESTFFHRVGWKKVIEQAFGHRCYYLYVEQGGEWQGVLPLVHLRSRLFGSGLISMAFCAYGGVLARTEAARSVLERAACSLAEDLGADYLEMRNRIPRNPQWLRKNLYVTFRKQIDPDPNENLRAIPRKQRAMIRKAIKLGLQAETDHTIGRLYDAYAQSVRNLGTPVFSRRYFQILQEVFRSDCEVLTITNEGRTVASVMSFFHRNEVLPYYGGGTVESRAVKGSDFMYWELMRRCSEKGVQVFDYGRSKIGTGSYRFKTHWGFTPEPLHYEYYLVKAKDVPNVSPVNPKYQWYVQGWKRLPLPVTRLLGPMIARNLG